MSAPKPNVGRSPRPAITALVTLEPDGFVSAWSAAAERLYGRDAAEMVGRLARELCADAFQDNHDARFERARDGFTDPGADTVHHHALGHHLEVQVAFEPLFAADGRVRGVVMGVDVPERTGKAVRALEREHALQPAPSAENGLEALRLLESLEDHAVFWLDPAGRVRSWSRAAERVKGHGFEVIGKHFGLFYPAALRAAGLPAHALEVARRDGRFVTEGWRVRADGSQFWASATLTPMRSPDGTLLGYAKVVRDAGARRTFEAQSWREEGSNTRPGELVMVTNAQLIGDGPQLLYIDEPLSRLLDSSREALVGQSLFALFDAPQALLETLRTASSTLGRAEGRSHLRGANGSRLAVQWRATAVADGESRTPMRFAWAFTPQAPSAMDTPAQAQTVLSGRLEAVGGATGLLRWLEGLGAGGELQLEGWGGLQLEAGKVTAQRRGLAATSLGVDALLEGNFAFQGNTLPGPQASPQAQPETQRSPEPQHLVVVPDMRAALAYARALGLHRFHATVEQSVLDGAERVALCSVSLRVVALQGTLHELQELLAD
jgi:PAS domain S-box-containing protein